MGTISLPAAPTVSNIGAQQRVGTKLMDITYDVASPITSLTVTVQVSTNNGVTYDLPVSSFSGAGYGSGVAPGTGKQIVWDAGVDWNGKYSTSVWFQVSADDSGVPAGMALIPAGSFTMGDTFGEGEAFELPTHSVYVSGFYMDKYEVSITLWDSVYQWGMSNGYVFATGSGKAPHHPVNSVTWNECVKWCNARSEKEGLTPCFYTDGLSTIYRTGDVALSNEWVNWSANGYRLPTEAEWEKAARGGTPGHRFSWSDVDTISHSQANYWSSDFDAYDVSPTRGYHPTYDDGVDPYTSPVGVFLANGYGLYDMTGNVDEWCWDWFEESWYSNAGATLPDTHGPSAGTYRVIHGGDWDAPAGLCRTSVRRSLIPSDTFSLIGFRCARRQ